jgi:hypothetical protein
LSGEQQVSRLRNIIRFANDIAALGMTKLPSDRDLARLLLTERKYHSLNRAISVYAFLNQTRSRRR